MIVEYRNRRRWTIIRYNQKVHSRVKVGWLVVFIIFFLIFFLFLSATTAKMVAKVWQRFLRDSHIKLLENLVKSSSIFGWWRTVFIESPTGDSPCHHSTAQDEDGGVFSKADVLRCRLQSPAEAHYELQLAKICFAHGATFTSAMKGPTEVLPPWAMGLKKNSAQWRTFLD